MYKLITAVTALIALAGCQTISDEVGTGPVKLSPGVAHALEEYLVDNRSIGMAVSEDGQNLSWYYCDHPTAIGCLMSNAKIIWKCEQRSGGVPCRMFAKYTKLTWQNPGSFMPFRSEAVKDVLGDYYYDPNSRLSFVPPVRKNTEPQVKAGEKEIRGSWEGVADRLTGIMSTDFSKSSGKVRVRQTNGDLKCRGTWQYVEGKYFTDLLPRGDWQAECTNGHKISGTYVSGSPGVGRIIGTDNKGRELELFF